jgi:hypothetical protein
MSSQKIKRRLKRKMKLKRKRKILLANKRAIIKRPRSGRRIMTT